MRNRIILLFLNISFATICSAQSVVQSEEHEAILLLNPWTQSQNAAGLGLSPVKTHGVTELGYNMNKGDYHRAQEGNQISGLNFFSERFDKLNENWLVWGSFNFQMDREMERCWSDVLFPYNSSPYLFGSSVKGNYDRQLFDLHAKLSTIQKGRFTWGVGIDYKVADLSRLRDPRSRTYLADYAAVPSMTFQLAKGHHIGFDAFARYQKEKMPNVNTVQEDPGLKYYTFFGMENADAVIAGYKGFQRQFVSNYYGADIQYAFSGKKTNWITSLGIETQKQDVLGDMKHSPGSFSARNYKGSTTLNLRTDQLLIHTSLKANYNQGAADELRQELITVRDTSTGVASQEWNTLFKYNNRYTTNSYAVDFDFNARNLNSEGNDYSWMAGAEVHGTGFENRYNMPFSEMKIDRIKGGLYGHVRLFNKKEHRITVDTKLDYEFATNSRLILSESSSIVPTTASSSFQIGTYDLATQVVLPDFEFYKDNALSYKVETKYSFPLAFKKVKMIGFTKLFYKNEVSNNHGSWMNAGMSIGIIPL